MIVGTLEKVFFFLFFFLLTVMLDREWRRLERILV